MSYAALVRPAIDRVYVSLRGAGLAHTTELVERTGLRPGFISSFYFGLLARPMSAAGFAAATTYLDHPDMTDVTEQGLAEVDDCGAWHLTERGRDFALQFQQAVAQGAGELWSRKPLGTLPWGETVPRLAELLGKLLAAGTATAGPAFHAMSPPHEPEGATPALQVSVRLGALRHHRADAHRTAWAAAGLRLAELLDLPPDDPRRRLVEQDTNRRDAPIYDVLTEQERWEFLALLAALPG